MYHKSAACGRANLMKGIEHFGLYAQKSSTRSKVRPSLSEILSHQKRYFLLHSHELFCIIFEFCIELLKLGR